MMDKVEMAIKILLMEAGAEEKEAEFYAKEFDDYFIEIAETFLEERRQEGAKALHEAMYNL